MKKRMILIILGVLLALSGCNEKPDNGRDSAFKVEISENYPIVNQLKETYAPGEEVTLKLETVTEHYYVLYVNEQEIEADFSDMDFTYFKFIMPSEDVIVKIEDRSVDIPEGPTQITYGYKSFKIGETLYFVEKENMTSIVKKTNDETVILVDGENLIADIIFHDGKIYYCAEEYVNDLYIMDLNGENKQKLVNDGGFRGDFHGWFIYKDNLFLNISMWLFKIDLQTYEWEVFNKDVSPSFQVYNDYLYYIDHGQRSFTIYKQDLETKEIEIFLGEGVTRPEDENYSNFVIAEDGTFYITQRRPYTRLISYKDGVVEVIENYENIRVYYDSLDELSLKYNNGNLYYVKNSDNVNKLYRYDYEKKQSEEIAVLDGYKRTEYLDNNLFCYSKENCHNPQAIVYIELGENSAK